MYTRTTTVIERSDVASVLFYRWKDGTYIVTFVANHPSTDCKYTKGGAMILVGVASMHGSVMNAILSMWNNHIKEIEKNA